MRHRVADFDLGHDRFVLAVFGHEQAALLENSARAIARNRPVILQRDVRSVGQQAN